MLITVQVYFKSWDETVDGISPTDRVGGLGLVRNVTSANAYPANVSLPIHVSQTNGGLS
jgi:galacturan 1,4-alpha-galacturonidase